MGLFAPFTFTSVVLLMSTEADQVWAAIRTVSKISVTIGVASCIFVVVAALGAKLAMPSSFPRDIPFLLSLSFLLFAGLHYACDHHASELGGEHTLAEDVNFMAVYYATCFFRVQGRVLAIIRTFLTCVYVPKCGVASSRRRMYLFYVAIWLLPAFYVLSLAVFMEPMDGLFTCWNMFGEAQFILDASLFAFTLFSCSCMLVHSVFFSQSGNSLSANATFDGHFDNPLEGSEEDTNAKTNSNDVKKTGGQLMVLPEEIQPESQHRTQIFASCVCLNCIMHLFLIYAIVWGKECIQGDDENGLCPDNISCPSRRGGGCTPIIATILLGCILFEDGNGVIMLICFGLRVHMVEGVRRVFALPQVLFRRCRQSAESTDELMIKAFSPKSLNELSPKLLAAMSSMQYAEDVCMDRTLLFKKYKNRSSSLHKARLLL
eukprot:SAG11_NODE_611_length_8216_cov_4.843661_3_plen_432_part_00